MDHQNVFALQLRELGDKNDYKGQGTFFCDVTQTTIEVVEAVPQKAPLWDKDAKHGIHYAVTLKNPRGSYTFDYWGSIHDAEMLEIAKTEKGGNSPAYFKLADFLKQETGEKIKGGWMYAREVEKKTREAIKPTAYDILTCLHPMSEDNFEDWCASYGYDTDSIREEKTYRACVEQDNNMRRLYTHDELEALQEIA